ncbi:MAG: DUF2752 domain-containing protein [Paludibacteraceae bacterium]|nr:DUF2752 domain-containing protein [Paludibacteraceae bacterium]
MSRFKPFIWLIAIEFAALVLVLSAAYFQLPIGCPFKAITGYPCPGCGGTRVLVALLHGQFIEALMINPLSVLVIIFLLVAPAWLFVDCWRGTKTLQRVLKGKWPMWSIILLALIITANWIWNIYKGL